MTLKLGRGHIVSAAGAARYYLLFIIGICHRGNIFSYEVKKQLLLYHHQKCWSLIGWNQVTWPAL